MFVSYDSHTVLFEFACLTMAHSLEMAAKLVQVAVFRLCLQLQLLLLKSLKTHCPPF